MGRRLVRGSWPIWDIPYYPPPPTPADLGICGVVPERCRAPARDLSGARHRLVRERHCGAEPQYDDGRSQVHEGYAARALSRAIGVTGAGMRKRW